MVGEPPRVAVTLVSSVLVSAAAVTPMVGVNPPVDVIGAVAPTELTSDNEGISAVTKARKVGAVAAPLLGPAKMRLTACVVRVPVSVPLEVIGEPDTVIIEGNAKATEVT